VIVAPVYSWAASPPSSAGRRSWGGGASLCRSYNGSGPVARHFDPGDRLGHLARAVRTGRFVVPLVLAFFYTWLYNKTGSVLLYIPLHASSTPAQDQTLEEQFYRKARSWPPHQGLLAIAALIDIRLALILR
jgi:hypothetical protein